MYTDICDLIVADQISTDGDIPVLYEFMPSDLTWFLSIVDVPSNQQALRAFVGVNTIPEPTSMALLLAGLLVLRSRYARQ